MSDAFSRAMTRLLATSFLLASTSLASAGVYGGAGIGPAPAIHDNDLAVQPHGRAGRLLIGYSFGRLGIEGALTMYGLADASGREINDGRQLSLSGKYNAPLGSGFEVFGRLGVIYSTVSSDALARNFGQQGAEFGGKGMLLGGGFEYRLKIPLAPVSLFVDYSIAKASLEGNARDIGYASRQWMLGFTIGI